VFTDVEEKLLLADGLANVFNGGIPLAAAVVAAGGSGCDKEKHSDDDGVRRCGDGGGKFGCHGQR
jgi:hypothetical protein